MSAFKKYIKYQRCVSEFSGRLCALLSLFLIAILCFEVGARYFFNAPTAWGHELSTMFFGAMSVLMGAYTLKHKAHVRTEIAYERFPPKLQQGCDLIVSICILVVFIIFFKLALDYAYKSWLIKEVSSASTWRPLMYPFKSTLVVALGLLILQTIADILELVFSLFCPHAMEQI